MNMIEIRNLRKTFVSAKEQIVAIDDISLSFQDKGLVFLSGRSGSGKSTFLSLLAGFEKPTSGEILFRGRNIASFSDREMERYRLVDMGFVFQNYALLENLSVKENIALGLDEKPGRIASKIRELLEEVSLSGYENRKVSLLSGGEKQRVAIARVLIKNPQVIFCDEPTGNLDESSARMVLDILKKRSKECLVIIVSHNISQIYTYGDRVLKLEKGKISEDVTYSEKNRKEDEIYLSDVSEMKKEELSKVNERLKENPSLKVKPRRYLFSKTQEVPFDAMEPKKTPRHHSFFSSVWSILKSMNLHKVRGYLFPFLLALTFSLCACFYQLSNINSTPLSLEAVKKEELSTLVINPVSEDNTKIHSFSKEDETALMKEAFPIYRIPLQIDETIGGSINNYYFSGAELFRTDGYSRHAEGVMVCDEDYAREILKVDFLNYVCKAEEEKDYGVYITDYLADSILHYRHDLSGYQDILGLFQADLFKKGIYHSDIYINGILKTGYQSRIRKFLDCREKKFPTFDTDKDAYLEYLYMRNALNVCYSFNPSFKECYDNQLEIQKDVYIPNCKFEGTYAIPGYSNRLSFDDRLEANEALFDKGKLMDLLSIRDEDELMEYIKKGNEKGGFTLSFLTVDESKDEEENLQNSRRYTFLLRPDEEKTSDDGILFRFSKDLYRKIRGDSTFCHNFQARNDKNLEKALKDTKNVYIVCNEIYFIQKAVLFADMFSTTMEFMSSLLFVLWILLLLFYVFSLARSQVYALSIYKACGLKKRKILLTLALQLFLFGLFSLPWMTVFYFIVDTFVNRFFISSLRLKEGSIHLIDVLSFDRRYLFLGIGFLFLFMMVVSFVIFFVLLKKRGMSSLRHSE